MLQSQTIVAKHSAVDSLHWYALWVYRGLTTPVESFCRGCGVEFYRPVRLAGRITDAGVEYFEEAVVPNLLFVRTTERRLGDIRRASNNRGSAYCYPGTGVPAPICDRDMAQFRLAVERGAGRVEQVDLPIDRGDRVRVVGGVFKGAEGYVRRVHGSRRFVVAVEGVVAVAVTHIPRCMLEPVNR